MRFAPKSDDELEREISSAARKLLFKDEIVKEKVPTSGSPSSKPERHLRTKVTINLDGEVVRYFKDLAMSEGLPYQVLINRTLRDYINGSAIDRTVSAVGNRLAEDPSFLEMLSRKLKSAADEGR
jgi:uncharacterized protein (DUF4415 family)